MYWIAYFPFPGNRCLLDLRQVVEGDFYHDLVSAHERQCPGWIVLIQYGVTLDCRIAIPLYSDPEILARIMENLVLNAMEAGGKGTEVRINAFYNENQRQAVIEVTDNGPGIPQHILPDALFEPYKTTKPGGSGIGLWQVRRLMNSLNGTVSAENVSDNGARFVLKLPRVDVKNTSSN